MISSDVKTLDQYVEKDLAKNINRSYSGMFKSHRMKVPMAGDYVVLSRIAYVAGLNGKELMEDMIYNAFKYSRDWKATTAGKSYWVKDIMKRNREGLREFKDSH